MLVITKNSEKHDKGRKLLLIEQSHNIKTVQVNMSTRKFKRKKIEKFVKSNAILFETFAGFCVAPLDKLGKKVLKGGDRRVRIFSAHNNWWALRK